VIRAKNLWQHPAGILSGQDEAVLGSFVLGQFIAFGQTDRYTIGVHEQMVLSQKPGKEHPMPIFVGEFLGKLVDLLFTVWFAQVTRLSGPGAQPIPECTLLVAEMVKRLRSI